MKDRLKQLDSKNVIAVSVISVFYMTFCFVFGVKICADSRGYMEMVSAREPVYPLFLAFLRLIFGKAHYLWPAIILQNVLMIIAVSVSTLWLKKEFSLNWIITYIMIAMHFSVVVLCQFVAKRSSVYSNSILTESLALPLWIILVLLVWKCIITEQNKYIIYAAILTALMMDIRKQMAVGFILICATVFIVYIGRKGFFKKFGIAILSCVIGVAIAILGTRVYNLALRGEFVQNTRDMNLVLTTTLYVADLEDAKLIDDNGARELFVNIMRTLDHRKANIKYAGSGLTGLQEHYASSYDVITIDTTADAFVDYAIGHGYHEGLEAEAEADRLSGEIVNALLMDNLSAYGKIYLSSLIEGFVNTVAKRHRVLDIYAVVAYILYLILTVLCLSRNRTRKAGLIGLTVLMGILANVCVTAALIFCQTRYMMYNMGLFYIAGILMLVEFIKGHRQ